MKKEDSEDISKISMAENINDEESDFEQQIGNTQPENINNVQKKQEHYMENNSRAYSTSKCEQNFDLNKSVEKTLNGNETIEIPDSDLYDSEEWDSSNEDEKNDKSKINVENFNGTIEIPDADLYDSEEWDSSNADENLNTTINLVSSEFSFNEQTATPKSRALLSSFGTDDYAKKHNDDENYVQQNHTNRFPPKKMGKEKLQTDEEDLQEGVEVIEDEVDDGYQKAEQNTVSIERFTYWVRNFVK